MIAWENPDFDLKTQQGLPLPRPPGGCGRLMRVLVLFAHPVETSFQAALHRAVVGALKDAGHEVDDCDLYAENFDPVLSRAGAARLPRRDHQSRVLSRAMSERLLAAEALVLVHPVWNFGYPAILKGFFDRVFLPGVSFTLQDGKVRPALHNIRKFASIVTYGGTRCPRHPDGRPAAHATSSGRCGSRSTPARPSLYLAHYDMNRATQATCGAFLDRVTRPCGHSRAIRTPGQVSALRERESRHQPDMFPLRRISYGVRSSPDGDLPPRPGRARLSRARRQPACRGSTCIPARRPAQGA